MNPLYIMKVGGSVCTKKAEAKFEANRKAIARIAGEIKRAMGEKNFQLILVHGAGPFGHTNVKNYGINNGIKTPKQVVGFIKTHLAMAKLNNYFLEEFEKAGLNPISLDPTACIVQKNKKILRFDTAPMEWLLKMSGKIVPVMYGDMVADVELGGSVISGDMIVPYLARKLKAEKVFLGTDVGGVFEADPKKFPKAKRIPLISKKNFSQILSKVSGSSAVDVTGGMKGKLLKIKEQLKGTNAFIFDASRPENAFKALAGQKISGTSVLL